MSSGLNFMAPPPAAPFTLRQLECFLAVSETGSIIGAADILHASGTAVADAITALELALGTKLFHRQRSRGAVLTSDGLAMLPLAHQVQADALALTAAVGNGTEAISGPVRVGVADPLPALFLPRLLDETSRQHPDIQMHYRTGDLAQLVKQAEARELDYLVTYDLDVPSDFERRKLTSTQVMLVVAANHRFAQRTSVEISELKGEAMVMLDTPSARAQTLELLLNEGVTPTIAHRTADYELCRSLVGRGFGYTLLMRRTLMLDTWEGDKLVYIPLTPAPRTVNLIAAWPQTPLAPRVQAVIDITVELGRSVMLAPPREATA